MALPRAGHAAGIYQSRVDKHTVDLAPRTAYHDTLAHLRYFAESMQQAVAQVSPDGMNFSQFEQELVKMKKRQLA